MRTARRAAGEHRGLDAGFARGKLAAICWPTSSTWAVSTRLTVQPPKPPPVIREPMTPPSRPISSAKFDQQVQLAAAHFVVVAERIVAGVHQPADRGPVARFHRRGGFDRAGDFADGVSGPAIFDAVESLSRATSSCAERRIAQRRNAELARGRFALAASLGILAAGELVLHVGVDDQHRDRSGR